MRCRFCEIFSMNKHVFQLQVEELNSGSPELAAHVPSQPAYEEVRGAVIG